MHSNSTVLDPTEPVDSSPARDLVLDLVRAAALAVVVVWHWVFSTVSFSSDGPAVGNPVGVTPGLWALTWILQPMPLFFAVGGCLHARSYDGNAFAFWKRRIRRLVVPALPLLVPALAVIAIADWMGRGDVAQTVILLISPLWFLAVYLVLVLLAPVAITAHRRAPVVAFAVLIAAAIGADFARFALAWSGPWMLIASFVTIWALVHQLGFLLDDMRRAPMITRFATVVGGLGGLAAIAQPCSRTAGTVPDRHACVAQRATSAVRRTAARGVVHDQPVDHAGVRLASARMGALLRPAPRGRGQRGG